MLLPPGALYYQPRSTPWGSSTLPSTASPWAESPSSCLQASFQREEKTFALWAPGRKNLVIRVPAFTALFQGLCVRVVTSHAIITQVEVHLLGEIWWWQLHSKAYRSWHLVHGKCWTQHKWFSVFHLHCQDWVVGWQACGLGKVKEGMNIVDAMECFGSKNVKTSKKITIADCGQFQ